jgi:hypothetical protein
MRGSWLVGCLYHWDNIWCPYEWIICRSQYFLCKLHLIHMQQMLVQTHKSKTTLSGLPYFTNQANLFHMESTCFFYFLLQWQHRNSDPHWKQCPFLFTSTLLVDEYVNLPTLPMFSFILHSCNHWLVAWYILSNQSYVSLCETSLSWTYLQRQHTLQAANKKGKKRYWLLVIIYWKTQC